MLPPRGRARAPIALLRLLSMAPLLLCPSCSQGPATRIAPDGAVILEDATGGHRVGGLLSLGVDPTGELDFEAVESGALDLKKSTADRPDLPLSSEVLTVWMRLRVQDRAVSGTNWVLSVRGVRPEIIDLYTRLPDGTVYHERSGYMARHDEMRHPDRLARLSLPPASATGPDVTRTLYLRATGRKFGPSLEFVSEARYHRRHFIEDAIVGAYVGLSLAMMLYNLFLFWALRDRSYLYYVSFLLTFAFYQLDLRSVTTFYLAQWSDLTLNISGAPLGAAEGTILLFIRSFLRTSETQPRLDPLYKAMLVAALVAAVSPLLGMHSLSTLTAAWLGAALSVVIPTACVVSVRSGYRPAWFFLVSFSVISITAMWMFSGWISIVPLGFMTDHGLMVGSAFDMIVLSLGLADRMRVLQVERRDEQRRAERAEQDRLLTQIGAAREVEEAKQGMFAALLNAREGERLRLSSQIGQGVGARLRDVEARLHAPLEGSVGCAAAEDATTALRGARDCLSDIHAIALDLDPSHLQGGGLSGAITTMVERIGSTSDVEIVVDVQPELGEVGQSGRNVAHMYRIVQESVSNALRHGEPTRLEIKLQQRSGKLQLEVRDNGRGYDASASPTGTLGLASMAERARLLGGELNVTSQPGHGTRVSVAMASVSTR